MTSPRRSSPAELAEVGRWLLILGAAATVLALLSGLPYFLGQSCSMALIGCVLILPLSVPALVIGEVLLLVPSARERRSRRVDPR